jgi:hypothetical protein
MFRIEITKTIKFKKIFEVIKDVFPDVYLKANIDGILLYQKSPSIINDTYILIAKLNNFDNEYSFKNTDYETEYLRIFDTNQIYKCVKNLTQTSSIIMSNESEFIILENKNKGVKHRIRYNDRIPQKKFLKDNFSVNIGNPIGSFVMNAREYTSIIKNIKSSDEFTEISLKLNYLKNGNKQLDFFTLSTRQEFSQSIVLTPHEKDAITVQQDTVVCQHCYCVATLILFIKSINLNSEMCLHFYEKGMIIQYQIEEVGQIIFYTNESTCSNNWE